MPAVAPPQHPGGQVQLGQDPRAELVGEPLRQCVVHTLHQVWQVSPGPPGIAARGQGHGRGEPGGQVVSHGVEDRGVQGRLGEGVVEGVAAEFVGRFQHGRGHDVRGADRAGRQEGPQHLGGQTHRFGAREPDEGVLVRPGGRDHHGEERGEGLAAAQHGRGQRGGVHGEDAEAFRAVHEGDPGRHAARLGVLHAQGLGAVGPAGERVVDEQGRGHVGERHEPALLDVGEVHRGVLEPQGLGAAGHSGGQVQRPVRRIGEVLLQAAVAVLCRRHLVSPRRDPGHPAASRVRQPAVSHRGTRGARRQGRTDDIR